MVNVVNGSKQTTIQVDRNLPSEAQIVRTCSTAALKPTMSLATDFLMPLGRGICDSQEKAPSKQKVVVSPCFPFGTQKRDPSKNKTPFGSISHLVESVCHLSPANPSVVLAFGNVFKELLPKEHYTRVRPFLDSARSGRCLVHCAMGVNRCCLSWPVFMQMTGKERSIISHQSRISWSSPRCTHRTRLSKPCSKAPPWSVLLT